MIKLLQRKLYDVNVPYFSSVKKKYSEIFFYLNIIPNLYRMYSDFTYLSEEKKKYLLINTKQKKKQIVEKLQFITFIYLFV